LLTGNAGESAASWTMTGVCCVLVTGGAAVVAVAGVDMVVKGREGKGRG
jgi:hypothetical protein